MHFSSITINYQPKTIFTRLFQKSLVNPPSSSLKSNPFEDYASYEYHRVSGVLNTRTGSYFPLQKFQSQPIYSSLASTPASNRFEIILISQMKLPVSNFVVRPRERWINGFLTRARDKRKKRKEKMFPLSSNTTLLLGTMLALPFSTGHGTIKQRCKTMRG